MTIDEIIEAVTIKFPQPLNLCETEKLLQYVADTLPGNVNYQTSQYKNLRPCELAIVGTGKVSGTINSLEHAFDSFENILSEADSTHSTGIRFATIPDYDLNEYRPEVQKLWGDVRSIVNTYFKEK